MQSEAKIKAAFMKGLADTDFTVYFKKGKSRIAHSYPIIASTFSSEKLAIKIKKILAEFKIKANIYSHTTKYENKIYQQWDIQIYGRKNLELWVKSIGFSNPRMNKRLNIWRKYGYRNPGQYE
jgi:hypothetical protein